MTHVRLGPCAPIRYRELSRDPKGPPPPEPQIRVAIRVDSGAVSYRRALTRRLQRLEPALARCFKPSDFQGNWSAARTALSIYQNSAGRVTSIHVYTPGNSTANQCLQGKLRAELKQLPAATTTGRAHLTFSMNRSAPLKPPDRIQLVDGRDRVKASLALAAAVAARSDALTRCVRGARLDSPGRIAATLLIEKGVVTTTDVIAPDELAACAASTLTDIEIGDPDVGGTFECAAGYGVDGPATPRFVVAIHRDAAIVAANDPIAASLIREQRPPTGALYRQLSERRFAVDGGRYAALRIDRDSTGELIVRTAEAASAADVEIAAVELERDDRWVAITRLADMPPPRLSRVAAQAAGPTVIASLEGVWVGLGDGHQDQRLGVDQIDRLASKLGKLRSVAGVAHRTDVVLGVGAGVSGATIGRVLEAITRAGFDQLELVSAETARARLAR